jgi:hypothetical protein
MDITPSSKPMGLATGIKGIRFYLATNARGWHVVADDAYLGFYHLSLSEVRVYFGANYTLVGAMGNALSVRRDPRTAPGSEIRPPLVTRQD